MPRTQNSRQARLGGDALIQLKGNQPRLLARLREQVRRRPAHDEHDSATLGRRNRIEQRRVRVWPLAAGSVRIHAPLLDTPTQPVNPLKPA